MATVQTVGTPAADGTAPLAPGERCILVLFGASGDLTKRLLMPALYNLACDGLLPAPFAVVGVARDDLTTDDFRAAMSQHIRAFHTRKEFDAAAWDNLCARLYYAPGNFDDSAAYHRLQELVAQLDGRHQTGGNVLFYLATPPSVFGLIAANLHQAFVPKLELGNEKALGWKRLIVEKPFGTDLGSAHELNRQLLGHWREEEIYRIDHYLGKETVQNILAFRFANEMYEPLWNQRHIDHIQLTVAEAVSVEGRGGYYDRAGVLRDMIQNHLFQMLAYVCMEPPRSFAADDIRDAKAKLLGAVRVYQPNEALANTVRGQYGAGKKDGGDCPAYRQEPNVNPQSATETFAALKLFIDNERWNGMPIYLRSGKALRARGTHVVIEFKRPMEALFRGTEVGTLSANRLIFHIQPDQAIETRFQAKTPGPLMQLQSVNMRFSYGDAFRAARGTGYEVLLFGAMAGDQTLFSRTDLVESAWRVAQPILDAWAAQPPTDFPNYAARTWGPRAAYELIERDGRRWFEVVSRETLERVPLFAGADALLLDQVRLALEPRAVASGAVIITKGEPGAEMYLICRGEVEVLDEHGQARATMQEGDFFGEVALLLAEPRTATVRARSQCDLFVLARADFSRILRDHQQFAQAIQKIAQERYQRAISAQRLIAAP